MTDPFAIHDYARTGELLFQKYEDLGKPGMSVPMGSRAALVSGYSHNGTLFYLSEFGGIAYLPSDTRCRRKRGDTRVSKRPLIAPWSACGESTRQSPSCPSRGSV